MYAPAGMPDYGDTAKFFAGRLTAGIDKERPIGMYVVPQAGEFHGIAFIPLEANGLTTILKVHKEQLGEPKDAGNGILEIGNSKTVFVKEQGGWAFVAEGKEYLTGLPQDPVRCSAICRRSTTLPASSWCKTSPLNCGEWLPTRSS